MVRWIGGGGGGSPIADAISQYAAIKYGDTLTPALKQQQLADAQREAQNILDLQGALKTTGTAWGGVMGGGGGGRGGAGPRFAPPAARRPQPSDRMALPGAGSPDFDLPAPESPVTFDPQSLEFAAPAPQIDPQWAPIRAGIFDGESGGDFDALFGYSNRPGGRFEGVQPSRMTVGEVVNFTDPSGEYGRWVRDQIGYVATPVGAYQGVGTTIRDAVANGVLDPNETFNEAAQERFGQWVYQTQGTRAWEGYRGPGNPDRYAQAFTGGAEPQFLPGATASPLTGAPATDPGQYNPMNPAQNISELLSLAVGAGIPVSQIGDANRMMAASAFGAENQATTDAFVGAGGNYASTYSGFAADQNRQERNSVRTSDDRRYGTDVEAGVSMRNQDSRNALALEQDARKLIPIYNADGTISYRRVGDSEGATPPPTMDGTRAALLSGLDLSRDETLTAVGAMPPRRVADSYVDNERNVHPSFDGLTHAVTGEPLPPGSIKTTVAAQNREGSGVALDKINARTTESQEINRQMFEAMLGGYETALQDNPTSSGMIGAVRRFGQNAVLQFDQFKQMFPEQVAQIETSNQENLVALETAIQRDPALDENGILRDGLIGAYDGSLSELEVYANLLPFAAAAALAGQEGRSVTDRDVQIFRRVIGDATSFWGNQQDLLNKVATVRGILNNQREAAQRVRREGIDGGAAPPTAAADPGNAPLTEDELRWLEGGQ